MALATISIVVLIAVAIGWREALVTFVLIPTTILLTLFASKTMGYTTNRVTLFALIFAIGILVDDAIVVIENIARHWAMKDGRTRMTAAVDAVAEVGNPTIVATLTVIAALLPMLFVSGLMGPYMAPIPVNASAAMLFLFFVAIVIAPWLMLRLHPRGTALHEHETAHGEGFLRRLYRRFAAPIVRSRRSPELGELHLNPAPISERNRASHAIALDLRARLTLPPGTVTRVVEVPPGPPVLSTLLAEVYGPNAATRRTVAAEVKKIFGSVPYITDIDDSIGDPQPRLRISIDQDRLEFFGVEQRDVYDTVQALFAGTPVGYSYRGEGRVVIRMPKRDLSWSELLASTPVPANSVPATKRWSSSATSYT